MKDNLHQVVIYGVEAAGHDPKTRRTATVTGYSSDGSEVHLEDHLEDGKLSARRLPVGVFMVHKIVEQRVVDEAVEAGLIEAAPVEPLNRDARRVSESGVSAETRKRMGKRAPPEHGANAAQADEFAEKH